MIEPMTQRDEVRVEAPLNQIDGESSSVKRVDTGLPPISPAHVGDQQ